MCARALSARGDVVAVTDPRGNRTEYVRDGLGRVVEATDAAGRVTGTEFDAAGRMVSETHADGTSTEYSYSPDGYLTQTQYTDQTVTYVVDVVGNRTSMTDAVGTSAWEFDWANRVVSDTDAHGVTQVFGFDAVGNQVRAEYADGRVLTRTFDGRGLAVSQSGPDGVTGFAYDADGNLTHTTRPSGVVTTTSYDLVSRATSIVHAGGTPAGFDGDVSPASGAPGAPGNAFGHCNGAPGHVNQEPTGCWSGDLAFGYDYDARGLVTERTVTTDEGATVTDYEHDALGRLTESVTGDYKATYGWDAGSNLVAESVSDDVDTNLADDGWVISRSVNNVNQVTKVVTDGRLPVVHTLTESLTYDARGNRTGSAVTRTTGKKTHDLARVDYTFDGMDQLVEAHDFGDNLNNAKDDSVTGWSRDGLGRGLSVSDNGAERDRVFDGTALIVDGDTRVTFGPDGRVLSEAFETVEGNGKNAHTITVSRDVLTDLLGSAVGIAEDGIINADLTWFGDFGDTLSAPKWDTVTSFTGHVETAGLVEFATRTYDPVSRVWVQEDSFTGTVTRSSSLNRYAYVEGSPVSHTDVLGAFRAAAAMAAQQLTAVDYAQFMADLKLWGLGNPPVCRPFTPGDEWAASFSAPFGPGPFNRSFLDGVKSASCTPGHFGPSCYFASASLAHDAAGVPAVATSQAASNLSNWRWHPESISATSASTSAGVMQGAQGGGAFATLNRVARTPLFKVTGNVAAGAGVIYGTYEATQSSLDRGEEPAIAVARGSAEVASSSAGILATIGTSAAIGGTIGTVVPVAGTVIGVAVGVVVGVGVYALTSWLLNESIDEIYYD